MTRFRDLPIRWKLTLLATLSSGLALLLASAAFVVSEIAAVRHALLHRVETQAGIVAGNSLSAVLFLDSEAATETLSALRADTHLEVAEIRTPDGHTFARYERRDPPVGGGLVVDAWPEDGHRFASGKLVVSHPILSEGAPVASVLVQADLEEERARAWAVFAIAGGVLVLSVLVSLLVSTRLQRGVSGPLLRLSAAAERVSEHKDYGVRVDADRQDELGILGRTFNAMLEQIERREAELRDAIRARDDFLSVASHELRTPLTALYIQIQSLERTAQRRAPIDPERLAQRLASTLQNVRRFVKLVNNLLDVSRITSGRLALELEPVDLVALAREVADRFGDELGAAECSLEVRAPERLVGEWDLMRLDQMLTNLLSNALKFGRGHPIEVEIAPDGERARLSVRDHGIGIPPEDQARIFERFERAVSMRNYGGLGLGLWITREIAEALGGAIRLESEPGVGSTFTLELPLKPHSHPGNVGPARTEGGVT